MRPRLDSIGRPGAAFLLLAQLVLAGCATRDPLMDHRMARWRPDVSAGERDIAEHPGARGRITQPVPVSTNAAGRVEGNGVPRPGERLLKRGDRIIVYLQGIPNPQSIHEEVDGDGNVTLPYIGTVHVEGKTTSEAEAQIEKAYIDAGMYTQLTVIVTAEADEYFISGEVNAKGRYPLTGDITLLKAISTAGDFTDFAKRSKVSIKRGESIMWFNVKRIAEGKDEDPLIEPGDIIDVERGIINL
jgi:polysaccharide export outer membrane protein